MEHALVLARKGTSLASPNPMVGCVMVREGQIVRVIDGPLTGFRGEVKKVDEQTAKVAVQVFGRVTAMDLALGQIELVPENSN